MASRGRVDHARGGHDAGVPCRTRADEALLLLTPVYWYQVAVKSYQKLPFVRTVITSRRFLRYTY